MRRESQGLALALSKTSEVNDTVWGGASRRVRASRDELYWNCDWNCQSSAGHRRLIQLNAHAPESRMGARRRIRLDQIELRITTVSKLA